MLKSVPALRKLMNGPFSIWKNSVRRYFVFAHFDFLNENVFVTKCVCNSNVRGCLILCFYLGSVWWNICFVATIGGTVTQTSPPWTSFDHFFSKRYIFLLSLRQWLWMHTKIILAWKKSGKNICLVGLLKENVPIAEETMALTETISEIKFFLNLAESCSCVTM